MLAAKQAQLAISRGRGDAVLGGAGLLAFLLGVVAAALTAGLGAGGERTAYLVMFFFLCAGVVLAAYRFAYLAAVAVGLQVLCFTAYRLYGAVADGRRIAAADTAWLFLPGICVGAMLVFVRGVHRTETLAGVLEDKVRSMEVVDPVTGLGNLRGLYMELERQMAYARRSGVELTLMLIELRYYPELKAIMSGGALGELRRRMGRVAEEALRLEDRVYAVDERGTLAIVCVGCGRDGASIVRERIVAALSEPERFEDILGRRLRLDVRVGLCAYDREEIDNAIQFKQRAENELQYDV